MAKKATFKPIRRLKSVLRKIPIDAIEIPTERPRAYQDQQSGQALTGSIARIGLLQPIGVRQIGKDRYLLVFGESRLRALREQGAKEVEARIFQEGTTEELELVGLIENLGRGQIRPIDVFNAVMRLRERGYDLREIAELTGLAYDTIKHYSRILNAPDYLKEQVVTGRLGIKHVLQLLRIKSEATRREVATRLLTAPRPWTVAELKSYIDHGVFAMCDECGTRDESVMKVGAVWLCPECRARVGLVPRAPRESPPPTHPCLPGSHEVLVEDLRRILACKECRKKIFAWLDSLRIAKGKPLSEIPLEEVKLI